jgi:hypothetical protein
MNTGFSKAFGACVPGFRARGLCPRPGMTMLQFKLRHYPAATRLALPRLYGLLSAPGTDQSPRPAPLLPFGLGPCSAGGSGDFRGGDGSVSIWSDPAL